MQFRIAAVDLVSNTCFPVLAADELGFFKAEGLEARIELGRLLFAQHNVTEAERELRLAWERSYHDPRIAELLVSVAIAAGREADADALLDQLDATGGTRERRLATGWLFPKRCKPRSRLASGAMLNSTFSTAISLSKIRASSLTNSGRAL